MRAYGKPRPASGGSSMTSGIFPHPLRSFDRDRRGREPLHLEAGDRPVFETRLQGNWEVVETTRQDYVIPRLTPLTRPDRALQTMKVERVLDRRLVLEPHSGKPRNRIGRKSAAPACPDGAPMQNAGRRERDVAPSLRSGPERIGEEICADRRSPAPSISRSCPPS